MVKISNFPKLSLNKNRRIFPYKSWEYYLFEKRSETIPGKGVHPSGWKCRTIYFFVVEK
jgi:hypothetical protein